MKTLLMVIILGCLAGYVWASTVTTQDGQNFLVTNDGGASAPMTNAQIMAKVNQFNRTTIADSQAYLSDSESLIIWNGVEQMAINAASQVVNNASS